MLLVLLLFATRFALADPKIFQRRRATLNPTEYIVSSTPN